MPHVLDVAITAPFGVGDVVAEVTLEDGSTVEAVLRNGRVQCELRARPARLRLSAAAAPPGQAPLATAGPEVPAEGAQVEVHELFEEGVEVPDGPLRLKVMWATHCHSGHDHGPGGRLFNSDEHELCARYVGLDAAADDAPPLSVQGTETALRHESRLRFADKRLTFGQIIALAGDFYAHLDERAADEFADAWPELGGFSGWLAGDYRATTLAGDRAADVDGLVDILARGADSHRDTVGEFARTAYDWTAGAYPTRRYLALASQNNCHFGNYWHRDRPALDVADNEALYLYRRYHTRARKEAAAGRADGRALESALATDAFGCHFLTDSFASGHMRVPRRILGERYGILRGALHMSKTMHQEDNELGLWCTTRAPSPDGRVVWRAYGDGRLKRPEARQHLRQVQEAVRRSFAAVFAAWVTGDASHRLTPWPEAILPVPLEIGAAPRSGDRLPDGSIAPAGRQPNHWPLYLVQPEGASNVVLRRVSGPDQGRYEYQDERGRSGLVLDGAVS